jgi:outer membrane protein TolC
MRRKFLQAGMLAVVLAALLSAPAPVRAAGEEAGGNLSLDQAIGVALKEHPAVKQFRENMAASREGIGVARSAYFPQTSFVGQYSYGNSFSSASSGRQSITGSTSGLGTIPSLAETHFYFYQFQTSQLLYDFGKTPNLVAESRANFKGSEQDYFGTRQQVVLDLRTAYFGYLAARRALKVQEETVRQNQELTKQAQGFYQVGLRAKIDVTKAEANLYQAEAGLIRAKNEVELARVTLMNALGIKTWPYKEVEDVMEVTPQPRPLEELLAQAKERRPEIQKNRFQQEFGQAAVKVARAGYFPTFSSTMAYGWQSLDQPISNKPSNWFVGATMTFPLFNGLNTKYAVAQNKAQLRATMENYEVLRQNATKEVSQSYLNVKTGWELIRATKKALEAARENLRLAWGRYQAGVGTIIEVTDAQVQFSQADLNFVQALYNYRVFEAQLDKAIGKPY